MDDGFLKVFQQICSSKQFFQNTIPEATKLDLCVSFRWGRGCRSNIISVAAVIPLKEFLKNSLRKFLIESSVNKSVAIGDSPQAILCKYVEVFLGTVASEKI